MVPLILLLWFVMYFGINVPFMDEWALVDTFTDFYENRLDFHTFWLQHNEHRLLFPKIIFLLLAVLTKWNTFYAQILNVVIAVFIFFCIYFLVKPLEHKNQHLDFYAFNILSSFLIFSFLQYENWLWGFQVGWFVVNLCVSCAILILHLNFLNLKIFPRVILAVLLCTIASFSCAHGLISWLALAPLLIVKVVKLPLLARLKIISFWISLFLLVVGCYFYGYHKPSHHPKISAFSESFSKTYKYFSSLLGSSLTSNTSLASLIGTALLIAFLLLSIIPFMYTKQKWKYFSDISPWLSFGLFSLFFTALTTIGRVGFGVEQALASRYTSVSIFLAIAVIQLFRMYCFTHTHIIKIKLYYFFFVILLMCSFFNTVNILKVVEPQFASRALAKQCLDLIQYMDKIDSQEKSSNLCIQRLFPSFDYVKIASEKLEKMKLRKFITDVDFVTSYDKKYGDLLLPKSSDVLGFHKNDIINVSGDAVIPKSSINNQIVLLSYNERRFFFTGAFTELKKDLAPKNFDQNLYGIAKWNIDLPLDGIVGETVVIKAWVYDPFTQEFIKLRNELRYKIKA